MKKDNRITYKILNKYKFCFLNLKKLNKNCIS